MCCYLDLILEQSNNWYYILICSPNFYKDSDTLTITSSYYSFCILCVDTNCLSAVLISECLSEMDFSKFERFNLYGNSVVGVAARFIVWLLLKLGVEKIRNWMKNYLYTVSLVVVK